MMFSHISGQNSINKLGEYRDKFKSACETLKLPLLVLREFETYQQYYNHDRPLDGIGLKASMGYYQPLMQTS